MSEPMWYRVYWETLDEGMVGRLFVAGYSVGDVLAGIFSLGKPKLPARLRRLDIRSTERVCPPDLRGEIVSRLASVEAEDLLDQIRETDGAEVHRDQWPLLDELGDRVEVSGARGPDRAWKRAVPSYD